jgi:REP element-mobilizing transposase RayT
MDRLLDAQSAGPTYLRRAAIAQVALDAIKQGASSHYRSHAWVMMPNHVHLLITPQIDPPTLLCNLKRVSSREASKLLARTGQAFWQHESCDCLVRSQEEFGPIEDYIVQNPVRAGLQHSPEQKPRSRVSVAGGLKPAAG